MCDYCGCRDVGPVGELSDEHEAIEGLADALRRRLVDGADHEAALAELRAALGPHLRKEERGLFTQLDRLGECDAYLQRLAGDHARARAALLGDAADRPATRPALLAGLDELAAHIELEEHDFFPASRLLLDERAWSLVAEAHRAVDAETSSTAGRPG